jgi:Uma2 family endonuclease
VGEWAHSRLQTILNACLCERETLGIRVVTEQRVQVADTRYRVPDVCLVAGDEPNEQILTSPPFICVEILSKNDRMSEM